MTLNTIYWLAWGVIDFYGSPPDEQERLLNEIEKELSGRRFAIRKAYDKVDLRFKGMDDVDKLYRVLYLGVKWDHIRSGTIDDCCRYILDEINPPNRQRE